MNYSTFYRSHTCGELRKGDVGKSVNMAGWVHTLRDHGGVIFIDVRDHYGLTQIVVDPKNEAAFKQASLLKPESVFMAKGLVEARSAETVNPNLPTGEIEVKCDSIEIDCLVPSLPFPVAVDTKLPEDLRLKYRFLDLRKQKLHDNIMLRSQIIFEMRKFLIGKGFTEFQTPILTVSSPEGARDYLVPSRVHPGKFYALPQAPQQYKQLIMCSGFDKYFQIAPCFRDEDSRADRSPGEFYQLDMEMSFISQDDLFGIVQELMITISEGCSKKKIRQKPFPRITYKDAIHGYGTDKPDLRIDNKMIDVTDIFAESKFTAFSANTKKGSCVKALVFKGLADESRSFFDKLEAYAKELGAKGLAYIQVKPDGLKSPILKFLSEKETEALKTRLNLVSGDAVFFSADIIKNACSVLGQVRTFIAREKNLIPENELAFCWVVDFPMFEFNEEENKIDFSHNPFSMPQGGLEALNSKDPLEINAFQYDLVCNGIELSSGAIRNHRADVMYRAFEIAGYSKEVVEEKFGHMLAAFAYGAPPHGGIAPGVDRLVMILADEPNIREVIMFPMNQKAQELMTGSPSEVSEKQLRELHIKLNVKEKKEEKKES